MQWKRWGLPVWFHRGSRKRAHGGAEKGSRRKNCNFTGLQLYRIKGWRAGCILNMTRESKMEIPGLDVVFNVMLYTSAVFAVTLPAKPPRWLRPAVIRWIVLLHSLLVPSLCQAQSPPPVGRPILFVHGFCDQAASWGILRSNLVLDVQAAQPTLYPASGLNTLYYDGQSVKTWPDGNDFLSTVPSSARFFSINFFDELSFGGNGNFSSINPYQVAQISVINKADELAHVIGAITALTHVKDVIVIAHSMGGLVARAYAAGWAYSYQSAACTDQDQYGCINEMLQSYASPTHYVFDIAKLITLDTPHSGAITANWVGWINSGMACFSEDTLNRRELQEGSLLISSLKIDAATPPPGLTIAAIDSYTTSGVFAFRDGVVTAVEQSIQLLAPSVPITQYYDIQNAFDTMPASCPALAAPTLYPLHMLGCLGAQSSTEEKVSAQTTSVLIGQPTSVTVVATLDSHQWPSGTSPAPLSYSLQYYPQGSIPPPISGTQVPWTFYDTPGSSIPTGYYTLSYISGGPTGNVSVSPSTQNLGTDPINGINNWAITFTLNFTSSAPSAPTVTTGVANNVGPNSATLTGTVNPNGSPTSAWFEWGTDSSLTTPNTTQVQSAGLGSNPVNVTSNLSGLIPNTTYYYRLAANGTGGPFVKGSILSFYTAAGALLPAPTLLLPGNNTTAVPPPTFTWTAVANATSYRLIVATNAGALPTDPTSPSCGTGCVLNVTPTGTSYVAPAGVFGTGVTYYWVVHARSSSQYGDWSAVFSFTTAGAVGPPPSYVISTFAGNGTVGFSGDNGPATSAELHGPQGVTVDSAGNVYIADWYNYRIRMVSNGVITTVAGSGSTGVSGGGFSGDNGPATSALLYPGAVAVDAAGNLYIADTFNNRIRKVSNGVITTVAGNGTLGSSGDNGPATSAELAGPVGVAVDAAGNLYIADFSSNRVRKVSNGVITTVASQLSNPNAVAVDAAGNVYIAEMYNALILKASNGVITTVAGNGTSGFSGDNGPATGAQLNQPSGVAVDTAGNLYIADSNNSRIRMVSNGVITTVAGNGDFAFSGDNGPATSAEFYKPDAVALDAAGKVYIGDSFNARIRVLTPSGASCSASVSPHTLSSAASGGNLTVAILTDSSCAWAIQSLPDWITFSGNVVGNGPASVTLAVATNPGLPRTATVSIAGASVTVNQAGAASLSITKTHTGNFTQGQNGATYSVTVSNATGAGPTSGTVSVTETVPAGLTLVPMSGTGWTCPAGGTTCTRSDALNGGASYPPITVTVDVAANATSPEVNAVGVSGGGSASANATDSTIIIANPPVLSIGKTHTGNFTQGQNGATYTVTVSNAPGSGPTTGLVTVTEAVPTGMTLVSMNGGTTWNCTVLPTCTTSSVLNGGSSYPAITVTVHVAANATSPQVNQVSVSGGGSAIASITDSTVILPLQATKVGTYNAGLWKLDVNGNGTFDPGTDKSFSLGWAGATIVTGDWNGDGRTKVGVYSNGYWFLDYDGNGVWDGGVNDKLIAWGWAGATPVVGDWNGDGKTKIGVYSNGFWFLDYNGDYLWDGGVVDKQVGWGWAGTMPIVGDWNGDGRTKIGVYINGFWFLDYDGNYLWDGGVVDKEVGWGWAGVTPIVGDWNGDGRAKIGVYAGGYWYLDYDGNYLWEYPAKDKIWSLGWTGTTPVMGDWNGDGKTKAGAFIDGYWYLDYNGNGVFDGAGTDRIYAFGAAGDTPVVGRW